ncbi:endonuclease/exonuclease/phosphatase family protein [Sphingomonas rhizophila]|uniref:Endonuclease/exonuclease/phosphatase family protein n=1 Tax=Sphingomonas rhizophila TaxID=2071607 RepID=A0A7G9SCT8_9SPHN|nr:endonuclease/exonuclease/phosphatase family protein [Sphingomonas rhizophila]QNN65663.1 endonuclease/exonuclease/phosphatase family protein [Sphingomonas rhizophila]
MTRWRRWGRRALAALATLAILLSFLPAWQTDRWWVRQWDYPRLQVAAVLLVILPLLFWAAYRRTAGFWALTAGSAAALAWQVTHFVAYLPPYPRQVASTDRCAPGETISLLNANVLQTNRDYDAVLQLVAAKQPDILLALETGPDWARAMVPLKKAYPYRLVEPVPSTYGMMLFSKLPMRGEVRNLLQPAVPSAWTQVQLRGGQWIDFYALHPEPPWPGDDSGERDAELLTVGKQVRAKGRAAIVMGDLNDVAWSYTSRLFKRVAGMHDPRVGRGFYPTFNANYPLLRWPLDHLFVSPHFKVMQVDLLKDVGSDHLPIYFKLCLTDRAGEREVAPAVGPATAAEANEEIGEGRQESHEENRGE